MGLWNRKVVVSNQAATTASHLTLRQSMIPNMLGTSTGMSREITAG